MQLLPTRRVRQPLICVVPDVILPIITTPVGAFTDTHPLADIPEFLAEHARAPVDRCCVHITRYSSVRCSIPSTTPLLFTTFSPPFSSQARSLGGATYRLTLTDSRTIICPQSFHYDQ